MQSRVRFLTLAKRILIKLVGGGVQSRVDPTFTNLWDFQKCGLSVGSRLCGQRECNRCVLCVTKIVHVAGGLQNGKWIVFLFFVRNLDQCGSQRSKQQKFADFAHSLHSSC